MIRTSDESRGEVAANPWNGLTVADMFARAEEGHGESPAVVDGELSLSFSAVGRLRDQLAGGLLDFGIREGDHVAIFTRRSWESALTLHALWYLGAVVVPMNTASTSSELRRMLLDADVNVLIASDLGARRRLGEVVRGAGLPFGGSVVDSELSELRLVLRDDASGSAHRSEPTLQRLIEHRAGDPPAPSTRQESLMLYTSGSSARPKCVVLRQDGILGTATAFMGRLGLEETDRFLSLGPYFHAGGIVQLLGCNIVGATHYLFDGFDVSTVVNTALTHQCTAVSGFDPVLARLLDEFELRGAFPLRKVACAPGSATYSRFREHGLRPILMYALTEGGNMVTISDRDDEDQLDQLNNGYPLPGISVKIADIDTGVELPTGEIGEICFKGWNLFRGYYNLDNSDGPLTDADDYFHTKDLGSLDVSGRLYYRGRIAPMIKTGGENVSAVEVEEFLVNHVAEIASVAVIGVPDETWGEAVVAFVELVAGADFDEEELRDACKGHIAGYKIPKRFVPVAAGEWPTTESGKLLKRSLVDMYPGRAASASAG